MNYGNIRNKISWTLLEPNQNSFLLWEIYEKLLDRPRDLSLRSNMQIKVSQKWRWVDFPFSLLAWIFHIYKLMGSFPSKGKYHILKCLKTEATKTTRESKNGSFYLNFHF